MFTIDATMQYRKTRFTGVSVKFVVVVAINAGIVSFEQLHRSGFRWTTGRFVAKELKIERLPTAI